MLTEVSPVSTMPYEWNSDKTVENRVRTEENPIFDVENLVESVEFHRQNRL